MRLLLTQLVRRKFEKYQIKSAFLRIFEFFILLSKGFEPNCLLICYVHMLSTHTCVLHPFVKDLGIQIHVHESWEVRPSEVHCARMRAALLSGRFSANALSGLTARAELRTHTFVPSLKVFLG
jgi:hypothetical protein